MTNERSDLPIFEPPAARARLLGVERTSGLRTVVDRLSDVRDAARRWPNEFKQAHGDGPQTERWIRLVASWLHYEVDPNIGLNGKRLSETDVSDDGLAVYDDASPISDIGSGRHFAFIDVIGSAGSLSAHPTWQNLSGTTPSQGRWLKPARIHDQAGPGPVPGPTPPPPTPAPTPPLRLPGRAEMVAAGRWLDEFYGKPEGLQRPQGLSINGAPDWEGVGAWLLDVWLNARVKGVSESDARAMVVKAIRQSDEWRAKHPGETP